MKKWLTSAIIGMVTGIANGFLGSGGGTVVVPCLEKFMKIEPHKSHATAIAIILPLTLISAFMYYRNLQIDLKTILLISIGGIAGGFTGAKLLNKISTKWLHYIFGGILIVAGMRTILWH